jgi:hypothetical protein
MIYNKGQAILISRKYEMVHWDLLYCKTKRVTNVEVTLFIERENDNYLFRYNYKINFNRDILVKFYHGFV